VCRSDGAREPESDERRLGQARSPVEEHGRTMPDGSLLVRSEIRSEFEAALTAMQVAATLRPCIAVSARSSCATSTGTLPVCVLRAPCSA
jgi:hypothetical protein